jgi:hypothetical protein
MWQREALWLSFHATNHGKYAVRVYMGQINAVSGQNMMEKKHITDGQTGMQQDYVVIPGQKWIDGVCVAPGIVRQFVAMPCE